MSYGQYSTQPRPSKPVFRSDVNPTQKVPKRLQHVFDNPAHVWAHPLQKDGSGFEQTDARNAQGNFYFKTSRDNTRVIYSYRDSYPVGARFEQGRKIIFLLRAGKPFSSTTAVHMSATRCGVPKSDANVLCFTVPATVNPYTHEKIGDAKEHDENVKNYLEEIADAIQRHSVSKASYTLRCTLGEAAQLTAEVKLYCKTFKLKLPALPKLPKLDAAKLAQIIEKEKARDAKRDAKRAAERAEYERHHQEEVNAWLASDKACIHVIDGRPVHTYQNRWECERQTEREQWEVNRESLILQWRQGANVTLKLGYSEHALLRVKDANVETSQGVDVPITGRAGAARLFRFLLKLKETGQTFQTNGHKEHIGNFSVTSFDGQILVAGCHKITWEEVLSISAEVLAVEQATHGDTQQA